MFISLHPVTNIRASKDLETQRTVLLVVSRVYQKRAKGTGAFAPGGVRY
jgi:hypothetical protein